MFVIQKSIAEMIMKSRDLSKLQKVKVTDKNGKTRTVYKRTGEQPSEEKQKKPVEENPVDTKKYSDMLDKVKNGPEENALSVNGKMLNKKDAMNYLSEKLGKKSPKTWADAEDDAYAKGQKKAREKYGDMSIEELEGESSESVNKITEYRNQLKDVAKKDPAAYMKFMDQANKDFQNYKNLAEKADLVSRSPYFANIPE